MSLAKILLCLDTDPQPSVFDARRGGGCGRGSVAAARRRDAGRRARIWSTGRCSRAGRPSSRTRPCSSAASDVAAGEALLAAVREMFLRADARVGDARLERREHDRGRGRACARKHVPLAGTTVTVLAATGSVGRRVVRLLAREERERARRVAAVAAGAGSVRCGSDGRAECVSLTAWETRDDESLRASLDGCGRRHCGRAPGVELLPEKILRGCDQSLKVAIDLNAVPPAGIGGIQPQDKAVERDGADLLRRDRRRRHENEAAQSGDPPAVRDRTTWCSTPKRSTRLGKRFNHEGTKDTKASSNADLERNTVLDSPL